MRTTGVLRLLVLAAAAMAASVSADALPQGRNLAVADAANGIAGIAQQAVAASHVTRVLHKKTEAPATSEDEEEEDEEPETPAPTKKKKKHHKTEAPAPAPEPTTTAPPPATTAAPPAPAPTTAAPAPAANDADEEAPAPEPSKKHKKKKKDTPAPAPATEAPAPAETEAPPAPSAAKKVNDKKIRGYNNTGVIDGSSEGSSEIDKIDLRNQDNWVSVYSDPPLLVIKASLYAFISYNDSRVCDSFNMTLNAVEQKADDNGTFAYHVVTYINCTKNGVDETPGRFVLNFIPEGKRLLLTECGHREEGEIVNWLKITDEVPECMTPHERKSFLAQPMKHIHASNGTGTDVAPKQTNFFARLEELDGREVAIAGSATVALIAVIVVIVVFVMRKRKAQKDLERTIAGAKAEHADDEDDKTDKDDDEDDKKEKKEKKKGDEEGSFVNSPAVKV